jgi:hypothetical protein
MEFCLNAAWVARAAERSKNAVSTKMICHNGGLSQISHPTTIDATEFLFIRYRFCDEWKKSGKRGCAFRRIDSSLRLEQFSVHETSRCHVIRALLRLGPISVQAEYLFSGVKA